MGDKVRYFLAGMRSKVARPAAQVSVAKKPSYIYPLKKWGLLVFGLIALITLASIMWKRYRQSIAGWLERRRVKKENSEEAVFSRFERACRKNNPSEAYNNFLKW